MSRPCRVTLALLATLALSACTSDDAGGGAVASTPLQGTFRGTSFVGKRAHAKRTSPSTKTVDIVEGDVDCAGAAKEKRALLVIVTWQTCYTREFTGDGTTAANAVLYYEDNGAPKNEVVSAGRVELIESSPEPGSHGRLRIRALAGDTEIEGEIALEVCD